MRPLGIVAIIVIALSLLSYSLTVACNDSDSTDVQAVVTVDGGDTSARCDGNEMCLREKLEHTASTVRTSVRAGANLARALVRAATHTATVIARAAYYTASALS